MGMPSEAPMDEYHKMTGEPCTCNGTPLRVIGEMINKAAERVRKAEEEKKNKPSFWKRLFKK